MALQCEKPVPPIVYLDSQDFSRLADVSAGRADPDVGALLLQLLGLVDAGRIIVPLSMGHLSELLQYEGGGRDLTLRKATVIEQICRTYAFRPPNDLFLEDASVRKRFQRRRDLCFEY